jgi:putative oxidoreductase
MQKNHNIGLLILRITLGVLMLFHGIAKITHGVEGIEGMISSIGLPSFLAYGVYIGEIIVPLLLIIGFRTRLAALVFAFNMLVALLLVHASDIFSLTKHGGWAVELIALYLFGAVALFFTGGGQYALSSNNKWD